MRLVVVGMALASAVACGTILDLEEDEPEVPQASPEGGVGLDAEAEVEVEGGMARDAGTDVADEKSPPMTPTCAALEGSCSVLPCCDGDAGIVCGSNGRCNQCLAPGERCTDVKDCCPLEGIACRAYQRGRPSRRCCVPAGASCTPGGLEGECCSGDCRPDGTCP